MTEMGRNAILRFPRAALLAVALLVGPSATALASPATLSPQALYSSTLTAGHAQRSVHWTSRAASGGVLIAMVCDVARTSGVQRISYTDGGLSGKATVMIVGGAAYLRGDAFTLTSFMGFKAIGAAKYANAWIQIPRTDPRFASVAAGVTLRSAIDQLEMVAPFHARSSTFVHGQKVAVVAGEAPGSTPAAVVLYARPGAPHLPVGAVSKSNTFATSIFFSRWNERVVVAKPAHAVLISQTGL